MLLAQADAMATDAGLSQTWPRMVMSLLRLALADRDADGDTLVNEEVLDQIALPLKAAGGRVLFGIHPSTAVKYVNAAHPDKALPSIR